MADESKFYYPLRSEAKDIDEVLTDLTTILNEADSNTDLIPEEKTFVKVKKKDDRYHYELGEGGSGKGEVELDQYEIPSGDGEDWMTHSGLYVETGINMNPTGSKQISDDNHDAVYIYPKRIEGAAPKRVVLATSRPVTTFEKNSFLSIDDGARVYFGYNNSHNVVCSPINGAGPSPSNAPTILMKGSSLIEIDNGNGSYGTEGCPTIVMHGGVLIDMSNGISNDTDIISESSLGNMGGSNVYGNKCFAGLHIHGNSRLVLDGSANLNMSGDGAVCIENGSLFVHGKSAGFRDGTGKNSRASVMVNCGHFLINGEADYRPVLMLDPEQFAFKGNYTGDGNAILISDICPYSAFPEIKAGGGTTPGGPVARIQGDTMLSLGGNGYSSVKFAADTGGRIKFDITSGADSASYFKIGADAGGQMQMYLTGRDSFVQLNGYPHMEMHSQSKFIMRGGTRGNYIWNDPSCGPGSGQYNGLNPGHMGLDWTSVLSAAPDDLNTGNSPNAQPSPIFQMFNAPIFTMRGSWTHEEVNGIDYYYDDYIVPVFNIIKYADDSYNIDEKIALTYASMVFTNPYDDFADFYENGTPQERYRFFRELYDNYIKNKLNSIDTFKNESYTSIEDYYEDYAGQDYHFLNDGDSLQEVYAYPFFSEAKDENGTILKNLDYTKCTGLSIYKLKKYKYYIDTTDNDKEKPWTPRVNAFPGNPLFEVSDASEFRLNGGVKFTLDENGITLVFPNLPPINLNYNDLVALSGSSSGLDSAESTYF